MGHTGKDCQKSRKAHRNTLNADRNPEDLRHKFNNVKEGDLRVKLNTSKKVSQVPQGGPAVTSSSSSPSLITVDLPSKSNNGTTHPRRSSQDEALSLHFDWVDSCDYP